MALTLLAANNAQTVLAAGISSTATSLTVNAGTGTLFPSPVAGTSFFKLTIIDAATGSLTEIVHVTARAGDVFTIQRGQEGTVPRAWSANDIAANMMTAGTLSYILGNFQPLDPTLTALAALVGVANKLPYFNGDDTAALTDLTSVGRDIIGKSTIADILTYLRLVDENGYAGRMVKISAFTTSGVFTKSEGAKFALVRAVGGGGGGGGTAGVSNQQAVGAAGESGGYIEAWIDLASVTSLPVTIGSAGAGGAAGANFGSSGGTTTLGTLVTCPGGNGGPGGSSSSGVPSLNSDYGSESTVAPSTTGKLIASIRSKRDSYRMALSLAAVIGGCGGSSPFGRGGAPGSADSGKDGQGYGSGGGGASSTGTSFKGGNGTPGIMIIQEYF